MATYKGTITSAQVSGTHTNFPVYVDLTAIKTMTQAEADSIRVYSDEALTTELPREIVSTSEMHFKSGTLAGGDEYFVDFDGVRSDYAITDTYGAENVWTGYKGVWHFNESSGGSNDSTSNSNNLSDNNTVGAGTGKIDGARDFELANSEYLSITDASQTGLDITGDITFGGWVNFESQPPTDVNQLLQSKWGTSGDTSGYAMAYRDISGTKKMSFWLNNGTLQQPDVNWSATLSTWYHIYVRYDASAGECRFYINGSQQGTTQTGLITSIGTNPQPFVFGTNYNGGSSQQFFDGLADEQRITNTDLGADWITTEYNNQNAPATFWTWEDIGFNPALRRRLLA